MTDLEITRRCAVALRAQYSEENGRIYWIVDDDSRLFDPLQNDAQAILLLKHFKLKVSHSLIGMWVVSGHGQRVEGPSLNRAICECVAKL